MICQILFSGENKKNISKCRLLKFLPKVLSVKTYYGRSNILYSRALKPGLSALKYMRWFVKIWPSDMFSQGRLGSAFASHRLMRVFAVRLGGLGSLTVQTAHREYPDQNARLSKLTNLCLLQMSYNAQRRKRALIQICGQRRPWSACAFAQAYQRLRYHGPFTESMDTVLYVDEQRILRSDCTDAHADLDLSCPQIA